CTVDVYSSSGSPAVLTIDPGVTVAFSDGVSLNVGDVANGMGHGALLAEGTETNPIVFTSAASTPVPGSWGGVFFDQTSDASSSHLDHCVLDYGGGDDGYGAALAVEGIPLHVNNTKILKTGHYGVLLYEASATLDSVLILSSGN